MTLEFRVEFDVKNQYASALTDEQWSNLLKSWIKDKIETCGEIDAVYHGIFDQSLQIRRIHETY